MKLKIIVAVVVMLIPVAGILFYYALTGSNSNRAPVAEVNGSPISVTEFKRELARQRAAVIDYYYRTYGAEYGGDFWRRDYNGEIPEDTAKERALKEIVRIKLELELAKQHGLIQGTSYDDLIREMDKENKRRLAAAKAHEPIYGPVQLDERAFMDYYISKLRNELKEKLSEDELSVSDEELKRQYELVKDTLLKNEDRIKFEALSVSYKNNERSSGTIDQQKQTAKKLMDAIKPLLDQGKEMEEAAKELKAGSEAPAIRHTEEEFNDHTARTFFKSQPVLYSILAGNLGTGQVSSVFDEAAQGEYVLIKVLERETNGYKSFDENTRNVWNRYMDTAYTAFLNKLVDDARVHVYTTKYDKITLQ
ncbi:hypothetical protein [Paenibacillus sp. HJGM_3]|uniref:hypothetical protein n=1 Tax=Paenibacillus sp. HJGM_3 TaxID=3379816 RepID=UPI00385B2771